MVLSHVWGMFAHPEQEWRAIRKEGRTVARCYCSHVLVLALIPAVAGYIGTTQVGWQVGARETVRLTPGSALSMAVLFYATMLVAVFALGRTIHWMGRTYGASQPLPPCIALAAYAGTPLFLIGVMLLYPVLWVNMLLGLLALAYAVYLLYIGVPIMTGVSRERGFLYASAVLAAGLVMLVGVLAASVILWGAGIGPVFTA